MGSDESYFNFESFRVRRKTTKRCQQATASKEKGQPKRGIQLMSSAFQTNAKQHVAAKQPDRQATKKARHRETDTIEYQILRSL